MIEYKICVKRREQEGIGKTYVYIIKYKCDDGDDDDENREESCALTVSKTIKLDFICSQLQWSRPIRL